MVQELHQLGIIDMRHCSTSEQQADLMTKALDQVKRQANLLLLAPCLLHSFALLMVAAEQQHHHAWIRFWECPLHPARKGHLFGGATIVQVRFH